MARQVITRVTDDLDGSEGASPVSFGFGGRQYEIDLSEKNADKLEKALAPYIAKARSVRGGAVSKPSSSGRGGARDYDLAALREWAGKHKIAVPARGRVPQAIVDQYKASGGK